MLVTGSTGFVGRAISKAAITAGWSVTGIARGTGDLTGVIQADVAASASIEALDSIAAADVVVHSAGLAHQFRGGDPAEFDRVNRAGTENICRLAARIGAKGLILISSVAVYGSHAEFCNETSPCEPPDAYGRSKLDAERVAEVSCQEHDIELVILRLTTVVGPEDPGNMARLARLILAGRFFWIGDGRNRKTLVDCEDVARAVLAVAERGCRPSGVYNLTGESVEVRMIVDTIASAAGRRIPIIGVHGSVARTFVRLAMWFPLLRDAASPVKKWLSDETFSGIKFRETFDWSPVRTIEESLRLETEALNVSDNR
jgi:UDP-glucose 4-epimerase